jgi:hypothetical protein
MCVLYKRQQMLEEELAHCSINHTQRKLRDSLGGVESFKGRLMRF